MKQKHNSRFLTKCISPVLASAASLLIAPSLHAADITLGASDAVGVNSFVTGTNWSPSAPTSPANNYFVTGGLTLRSVANGGDATFLGNTLTLGNGTTSGTLSLKNALGATVTINNLTLNNGIVSNSGGGSSGSADGTFTLAGGVTLVGSGNQIGSNSSTRNLIVTASISGGGTLSTTTGGGTVTLSGDNSYIGGTNITTGTLQAGHNNAFGSGTITQNGGTLSSNSITTRSLSNAYVLGGNVTLGNATNNGALTFGSTVNLGTTQRTITTNSNVTFLGLVSNTGGFAKAGTGTLTLSGDNTYSGGTSITAGTLAAGSDGAFGTSKIRMGGGTIASADGTARTFSTGQEIDFAASSTFGTATTGNLKFNDGFHLGNGAKTATINNTVTEFAGIVADTAGSPNAFTKAGNGTLILSNGGNTYVHKTVIDAGTLSFATNALNSTPSISMNGGTLQWNGTNTQDVSSKILMIAAKTATFDTNGNDVTFGTAIGSSTTGSLVKTGAGTLTLSGTNTYTGKTTINGGSLALGTGGSINDSSEIALNGGNFNVSAVTGYAVGPTQSLTGSGSVTGNVTVNGTLAIGNSPGTITFDNNLTLGDDSVSNFQIESLGSFDLALGGALNQTVNFDGALNLLFSGVYANNDTVKIFDFEGYTGSFDEVTISGLGLGQTATFDAATGFVTVVPEPGAALLGSLGVLALLRRRRA